jgi:hypothetical protein
MLAKRLGSWRSPQETLRMQIGENRCFGKKIHVGYLHSAASAVPTNSLTSTNCRCSYPGQLVSVGVHPRPSGLRDPNSHSAYLTTVRHIERCAGQGRDTVGFMVHALEKLEPTN